MSITDSYLRAVNGKPQDKIVTKADRDGLSIRISPKGKIVFQFRYRWAGKAERLDIGSYPATSLKEARDLTLFYRGELEQNKNPKVVKKVKKQDAIQAQTVESLIRLWWEKSLKSKQVNAVPILRSFELYLFPRIGDLPHDEASIHVWLSIIENLSKTSPAIAERILRYSKAAHRWGIRRGVINSEPLSSMSCQDLDVKRNQENRILSDDELILLFNLIDNPKYNKRNALLIKLSLLFGTRVGELLGAEITDFDFDKDIWTIPPEKHKTGSKSGKSIIRPLIPQAKEWIKEAFEISQSSHYLFTVASGDRLMKTGHTTIIRDINKKMSRYFDNYTTWSIHDLRKTMRTGIAELTPPHVAEIMLGHKLPGIWQVYDKHTYLKEQREAYEKWWDKLTKIVYHSPNQ
ncbi:MULTISPECIES: tyrosine-type recombinase/integrase [unclassified Proteus (in: enterobacteria)]|uniref:tyrosine-type recombinase/integrase n=1 Tax=unclassified Proteus (in: enterobacteria) TaxID=257482 RepID=UPI000ED00FA3|nr:MULTISPECIES: site-specific integrase [unclassified Proteus (in: enterobacteria)]NBM11056.1 tyrosine-type recombinase/integrase [Proteus sp. G2670]NBM31879.1 tyrosine-type recombinase/integrase [Proteus sp. G2664]HCH51164.1 integrase [Proteus sp. (in: enterobacteria)]